MKMNLSRRFGNIKIGTRLALSFGLIFVLILSTLAFVAYSLQAVNERGKKIVEYDFQYSQLLSEVNDSVEVETRAMRTIMLLRNYPERVTNEKKKIDVARKKNVESIKQLLALAQVEYDQNQLSRMAGEMQNAREQDDMVLSLSEKGQLAEAVELLLSRAIPAVDKWKSSMEEYAAHNKQITGAALARVGQQSQTAFIVSVLLSICILMLVIVASIVITRSITNPLDALKKAINDVREGGEMGTLAQIDSRDEFADMGLAVNEMLQEQISMGLAVNEMLEEQISVREKADEERRIAETANERLNNSVIALLSAVNQLSQRDLTARMPMSGDIIDTVADSINQLTDETAKVLHVVSQMAGQMEQVSASAHSQGQRVAETSEQERQNVAEMVTSLSESAENMGQMADVAEQSNRRAAHASEVTQSALETVNNTVKGMESIRETIAETEKRIKRLGERSQEISGIVNLINTISERTHVLALNASMQAAVAGDAGRGFAVVAEEVQRLAESSRLATQQIGTLVSNIQLETNETISTVNRTIGQVVQGSEQAQKAGEQMRLTREITGELVEQVKIIAGASGRQKAMSGMLLESVARLSQSNERTAQQIETQGEETQALIETARQLVESVNVFKLPQVA